MLNILNIMYMRFNNITERYRVLAEDERVNKRFYRLDLC